MTNASLLRLPAFLLASSLIVTTLASCGGGGGGSCKTDTLTVSISLQGAAASADRLAVSASVEGGSTVTTEVAHTPGQVSSSIDIRFPEGYPKGKIATVTLSASRAGVAVGSGSSVVMLTGSCGAMTVTIVGLEVDGGVDALGGAGGSAPGGTGGSAGGGAAGGSGAGGSGAGGSAAGGSGAGGSAAGGSGAGGSAAGGSGAGGSAAGGALGTGGGATGGATGTGGSNADAGTDATVSSSVCGNGKKEPGEACDSGPLNGLFLGDGSGCSKTCTREPICRTNGTTRACDTVCGNGYVEPGEACDDGNLMDGDGCSSGCTVESGFSCSDTVAPDTEPCQSSSLSAQCLRLPITYRDFKSEKEAGGHPDFFYYGAPIASATTVSTTSHGAVTFSKRYCVPNSAGPARANSSTARCWDLAKPSLNINGKPAFNTARADGLNCDCEFVDYSHDTNGGHVPGYVLANSPLADLPYVSGPNAHPIYKGFAPGVTSETSFGQWFVDGAYNVTSPGTLELAASAGVNEVRYASAPHSVYGGLFPLDPIANNFPVYSSTGSMTGPGTVRTTPAPWNEPLLCNIWPYWFSSATFGAGNACRGDQYLFPPSVDPSSYPNGRWVTSIQGWFHDFWYTAEARYLFAFNGPIQLQVAGTAEIFVFVNGRLVIDLGGTHQTVPARAQIDATGNATIAEGGSINPTTGAMNPCSPTQADPYSTLLMNATCPGGTCDCRNRTIAATDLGLEPGRVYELAFFLAYRHPTEANLQLAVQGLTRTQSACTPR